MDNKTQRERFEEWADGAYISFLYVEAATVERCAVVVEATAERVRHTSNADGLGMGDMSVEGALHSAASALRALKDGE